MQRLYRQAGLPPAVGSHLREVFVHANGLCDSLRQLEGLRLFHAHLQHALLKTANRDCLSALRYTSFLWSSNFKFLKVTVSVAGLQVNFSTAVNSGDFMGAPRPDLGELQAEEFNKTWVLFLIGFLKRMNLVYDIFCSSFISVTGVDWIFLPQ